MAQIKIPFGARRIKRAGGRTTPPASGGDDPRDPERPGALGVTELITQANLSLERHFGDVWVEGEISNLHLAGSGHAYFTLKDDRSALPSAMWRSSVQRLKFRLEEGMQIRVHGRLGVYGAQGKFQLYADRAEPAGRGDLLVAFEQLKQKLASEGLFDADRKRPLPRWPRTVGIVTSARGAAVHDIIEVTQRRCPTRMLLSAALVQGDAAPADLRRALARLERQPDVDVIIIGRGGGSSEDLWAFNDEELVRAVAACPVPVISAVGHEVDVTLCDLVADRRAATPSQAGELAVVDLGEVRSRLRTFDRRIHGAIHRALLDHRGHLDALSRRIERRGRALLADQRRRFDRARRGLERTGRALIDTERERLEALTARLEAQHPRVRLRRDRHRLERLHRRLTRNGRASVGAGRLRLARAAAKLDALSPLGVLARGYAVLTDTAGALVRSTAAVEVGDDARVRLADGTLAVRVHRIERGSDDAPESE